VVDDIDVEPVFEGGECLVVEGCGVAVDDGDRRLEGSGQRLLEEPVGIEGEADGLGVSVGGEGRLLEALPVVEALEGAYRPPSRP